MRTIAIASMLALCGCDKINPAPESTGMTNHVMQLVDHANPNGNPDYWIYRDARTGHEYLIVTCGASVAVTKMQ